MNQLCCSGERTEVGHQSKSAPEVVDVPVNSKPIVARTKKKLKTMLPLFKMHPANCSRVVTFGVASICLSVTIEACASRRRENCVSLVKKKKLKKNLHGFI